MNYEEMSDYEINCLVVGFVNPECVKFFRDVPNKPSASGYNKRGIHLAIADYCNNPADWGKLMEDNKISTTWWPDEEGGNESCWEAATGKRWENSRHKTSPGRAVSICYLKSKEAK